MGFEGNGVGSGKNVNLVRLLVRCNWVDVKCPVERVKGNLAFFEECGIVGSQLVTVMTRQPRLLIMGELEVRKLVARLLEIGLRIRYEDCLWQGPNVFDAKFVRREDPEADILEKRKPERVLLAVLFRRRNGLIMCGSLLTIDEIGPVLPHDGLVLETARHVASLPVSSTPVTYDQVKDQCEALVTGKQQKMSVLQSFKKQQEGMTIVLSSEYDKTNPFISNTVLKDESVGKELQLKSRIWTLNAMKTQILDLHQNEF
ncbi:transcription termination factor MTERF5, chloroplastic-like protein [Tanacetum coccineum]